MNDLIREALLAAQHALDTSHGLLVYDKDGPHSSDTWPLDHTNELAAIKVALELRNQEKPNG